MKQRKYSYKEEFLLLGKFLCDETGFSFKPIRNRDATNGYASISLSDVKERYLAVGVGGFGGFFNKKSENDIDIFAISLKSLFHEYCHVRQFLNLNKIPYDDVVSVSLILREHNAFLYNDNYTQFPHEILAEKSGILETYKYLKGMHEEVDAWATVKKLIMHLCEINDARYKGKGFEACESIEDVEKLFDSIYEKSLTTELYRRNLDMTYSRYKDNKALNDDIFEMYRNEGETDLERREKAKIMLDWVPAGYEQMKFLAAYTLARHGELVYKFKSDFIRNLDYDRYVETFDKYHNQLWSGKSISELKDGFENELKNKSTEQVR